MRKFFTVLAFVLAGCGAQAPTAESVEIMAKVTKGGQPVVDVDLNFQPTGAGLPRVIKLKDDGQFLTTMIPGTYTYYFTPGSRKDAFEKIPAEYRAASMDRQIEINDGREMIELALE